MIFLIIFLAAIGAWEMHVFFNHNYPEDLLLMTAAFGVAMFLFALWLNGVGV